MISRSDILKGSILIVDDKDSNIFLLEEMLREAGYVSIASTKDPREVCELHRKNRYDLILLDLQMPGMDGFQVMEDLEKIETSGYLPVLVVTAQPNHKVHALTAGAKDFVSKPFELPEVLVRVYNMIEVRLLRQKAETRSEQAIRASKSALLKEVVQRELTAVSLQASQSELVLARGEIERASAEHTAELERSNHELEQFAYVASHDLQEPLRAISGCVQILEKRYAAQLDPQGHELIAHTVQGVARLQELIEGLLAYSRVGRLGAEIEAVCAETALAGALGQLESAIKETGGEIEHGPLPTVCANASQLVQLLQNLIGNALKYRGAAAPRIKISALRADLMWIFAIRDNGIGIEPQYFDRVFSIFQRLHTRDEYPGTGIGLSLCRRIVEQAGGLIWIKSELGKGSTFYFTLPAILEPAGLA